MSDRASRLREKRSQSNEKARAQSEESDQQSKPSKTDKTEEPEETAEAEAEAEEPEQSDDSPGGDSTRIKDEQVGTYLYLPESQREELNCQYKILSAEYEREFSEDLEKNRHFYPLVVEYGLPSLESADPQDVREMLEDLDY